MEVPKVEGEGLVQSAEEVGQLKSAEKVLLLESAEEGALERVIFIKPGPWILNSYCIN